MKPASVIQRLRNVSLTSEKGWSVFVYVVMYGSAILFSIPYLYMITTSIQPKEFAFSRITYWIPPEVTFEYYQQLIVNGMIVQWTINTFLLAIGTTLLVLVVDSLVAFGLTQLEWPGRSVLFSIIIASFMIPAYVNIIPLYTIIINLGLLNNVLGIILPFAAGPLGVFLLVQFFRNIPEEYIEAAQLDGFSTIQIYTRIVLPLSQNVLSALALFIFVWSWNQFLWPLIVLQNQESYTLPVGLVTIQTAYTFEPSLVMASAVIASAPLFVLFILLQNQLISAIEYQSTVG